MIGQPCRDRGDLPVRQNLDDLSPLEVTDNRAITVVPAEREVVDANGPQGIVSLLRPLIMKNVWSLSVRTNSTRVSLWLPPPMRNAANG